MRRGTARHSSEDRRASTRHLPGYGPTPHPRVGSSPEYRPPGSDLEGPSPKCVLQRSPDLAIRGYHTQTQRATPRPAAKARNRDISPHLSVRLASRVGAQLNALGPLSEVCMSALFLCMSCITLIHCYLSGRLCVYPSFSHTGMYIPQRWGLLAVVFLAPCLSSGPSVPQALKNVRKMNNEHVTTVSDA